MKTVQWILVSLLALSFMGCSVLKLTHEPRFTTGSDTFPQARANYPQEAAPGVPWGDPAPYTLSMYDLMVTFNGDVPAGRVPVQRWVATGTTHDCTNQVIPFAWPVRYEYWNNTPANDIHWHFIPAESYIDTYRNMDAGFLLLPGAPPAIPAGENVAFLNAPYFAALGNPDAGNLQRAFTSQALLQWQINWEYDGCHAADAAETRCGEQHCLDIEARNRDSPTDNYGDWENKRFDNDD